MAELRVGIMGSGSIGCYVGGRLLAAGAAAVIFIGRENVGQQLMRHGLTVSNMAGEITVPPGRIRFSTDPAQLAACDIVLVSVKSGQTEAAGRQLVDVLDPGTLVVSLQNGVRNPQMLRSTLGSNQVLAGVVDFNVVSRGDGVFHCGLGGPLSIESSTLADAQTLVEALRASGVRVKTEVDIAPVQWTKLLVNLNNAVSALSGAPTRDLLLIADYRRVVAAVLAEGVGTLRAAGIKTAPLRGVPAPVMPLVLRLPDPVARFVLRSQIKVDSQARSSMWEDLNRRRPTEVDFLNGEIVNLALRDHSDAPINRRIVELVHAAETAGKGPPGMSADRLWRELQRA